MKYASRGAIFVIVSFVAAVASCAIGLDAQDADPHAHHAMMAAAAPEQPTAVSTLRIPDVQLVDQSGRKVHFYSDLVKGKLVAINTIFTTCTTICPLMGANFARLSHLLSDETKDKLNLISITIDPSVDTPARLAEWQAKFGKSGTGANWTLLTGSKSDIDTLLKALQVFTADKQDHAPTVLIGGEGAGDWARASALLPPTRLAELIRSRLEQLDAAYQYFTDVRLVTQNGESVRLYSDLLKSKVVIINAFFATCTGACPKMAGILAGLQERFGERVGKDIFFLSFSVDPESDTPEKLKEYAAQFHARPGWLFLTGDKANVDLALTKLGQKVARKEDHLTIFIIGNTKTGLWKKVLAPGSTVDNLEQIVESVLNDKG